LILPSLMRIQMDRTDRLNIIAACSTETPMCSMLSVHFCGDSGCLPVTENCFDAQGTWEFRALLIIPLYVFRIIFERFRRIFSLHRFVFTSLARTAPSFRWLRTLQTHKSAHIVHQIPHSNPKPSTSKTNAP
jgi:hypothetical protein